MDESCTARGTPRIEHRPVRLPVARFKKLPAPAGLAVPDRAQLTMTVRFMRAYTSCWSRTCHPRARAHAIGGMAAFIPNRRDPAVTETALARVRDDKERGVGRRVRRHVGRASGSRPGRGADLRPSSAIGRTRRTGSARRWPSAPTICCDLRVPGGAVTEAGSPGERPGHARLPRFGRSAASAPRPSTTSWKTPRRPRSPARSCGCGGPAGPRWPMADRRAGLFTASATTS